MHLELVAFKRVFCFLFFFPGEDPEDFFWIFTQIPHWTEVGRQVHPLPPWAAKGPFLGPRMKRVTLKGVRIKTPKKADGSLIYSSPGYLRLHWAGWEAAGTYTLMFSLPSSPKENRYKGHVSFHCLEQLFSSTTAEISFPKTGDNFK